jgi:hypothetical protein
MISKRIDKMVESIKWPVAVAATATIPMTFYAWGRLLYTSTTFPAYAMMFYAGIMLFAMFARTSIAQSGFAIRFIELERDLTQSILALVMLHPVVGYGQNQNKGSRVRWLGRGNWLMLASPYFVPTAAIILWFISLLLFQSLRCLVLGFGISYHIAAVLVQCHIGTSELRRLGRRFCWMFLPAVNLLVAGCIAAFALDGLPSVGDFLYDWISMPRLVFDEIWGWLQNPINKSPNINSSSHPKGHDGAWLV